MKFCIAMLLAVVSFAAAATEVGQQPMVEVSMNGAQYTCPVKGADIGKNGVLLVDFTRNSQAYPQGVTECQRVVKPKVAKNETEQARFERLSRLHPNWP